MANASLINSSIGHVAKDVDENTKNDEEKKANIFTIVAADTLMSTIRPAIEHIFWVGASRFPEWLGNLYRFSDEIILSLDLLIQRHYLNRYSALFPEHFYGMERVRKDSQNASHCLNTKAIHQSLLFHAVLPYVKIKLEKLFHNLKERYSDSSSTFAYATFSQKLVKIYLFTYPYIHMFWEGSYMIFYLLYAIDKSCYHSVLLWLQNVQLHQLSAERLKEMELNETKKDRAVHSSASFKDKAFNFSNKIASNIVMSLTTSFEIGAFFIQFLDWWYANAPSSVTDSTSLPIPPPPIKHAKKTSDNENSSSIMKCPICRTKRKNETLVPSSGYVFCYKCIVSHLRSEEDDGSCPVTGLPVRETDLIRLFPPGSE